MNDPLIDPYDYLHSALPLLQLTAGKLPKLSIAQQDSAYMNDELKYEGIELWFADGDIEEGGVMNDDGHGSNTQKRAGKLFSDKGVLNGATPSHCTADALQQFDRRNGIIQRVKRGITKLYRKTVAQSPKKKKNDPTRGKIKISTICAIVQTAARAESESMAKQELFLRDNGRVGYFVGDDGLLDYDPLRTINVSRFTTSSSTDEVAVLNAKQVAIEAGKKQLRDEMEAADYAWDRKDDTGIASPTMQIPRGVHGRKSENETGVVTSSPASWARKDYESAKATQASKKGCEEGLRFSGQVETAMPATVSAR